MGSLPINSAIRSIAVDPQTPQRKQKPMDAVARLNALREERRVLEAEIAEAERIVDLETQREALLNAKNPSLDNSLT